MRMQYMWHLLSGPVILSTIRIHVWHERALCRVLIVTDGLIAPS